ncbi:hypothetical protein J7I98_33675 [Streptomyces sp. ISL-98]|uniref:hypothetical protein n=1 Tax=Streptomyces sp. ISL-98 TaxID=2819192 RepID=UPI001BECD1A0|nr:hypothetical protein [Streptomyces sp. ISL-98]MBT2510701.1 hypothetical protein [Streptomyces sp. ISL-98]
MKGWPLQAALGGPEIRKRRLYTRILARCTMNAWRMLTPEISPAPKSPKHTGRAQVVLGGTAHETPVLFFTEHEAREWAMNGTHCHPGYHYGQPLGARIRTRIHPAGRRCAPPHQGGSARR